MCCVCVLELGVCKQGLRCACASGLYVCVHTWVLSAAAAANATAMSRCCLSVHV